MDQKTREDYIFFGGLLTLASLIVVIAIPRHWWYNPISDVPIDNHPWPRFRTHIATVTAPHGKFDYCLQRGGKVTIYQTKNGKLTDTVEIISTTEPKQTISRSIDDTPCTP
jgi:hypothetical protein